MSEILEMEGGGKIHIWEDSGRVFFRCERPISREGLYKVWLCGDRGEVLLGTLVPEGEKLILGRSFRPDELRRQGCWPARSAVCKMVFPFRNMGQQDGWFWEPCPQRFVSAEVAESGTWQGMLAAKEGKGIILASPLKFNMPFPVVSLFCFAVVQKIRGELCLVWYFDSDGRPYFP